MLIKSLNMRECGGLLFQPRRELTREACCRWKLRFVDDGARAGLRHRRSTMAVSMTAPERTVRALSAGQKGSCPAPVNKTSPLSLVAQVTPTKPTKKSSAAPDATKDQVTTPSSEPHATCSPPTGTRCPHLFHVSL